MQKPIPTQLHIAPRGKTSKNWKRIDGDDGVPTREAMDQYLCATARIRELEECRALKLETIKRLNALLEKTPCQGSDVPHGGLHQISEPITDAALLHTSKIAGVHPAQPPLRPLSVAITHLGNLRRFAEAFAAQVKREKP